LNRRINFQLRLGHHRMYPQAFCRETPEP